MSLEEALQKIPSQNQQQFQKFVDAVLGFSSIAYTDYFETCGLYLVGSALKKSDPHDIDITLVGLDFRALYTYDYCYTGDTEALIESGRLVLLDTATNPNDAKVVHNGQTYCVDFDTLTQRHHITVSPFTKDLIADLDRKLNYAHDVIVDSDINPLHGYNHEDEYFGGSRVRYGVIDFFLHGENLHVSQWKSRQQERNLPFVIIREWDKIDNSYRPRSVNMPFPHFIKENTRLFL